MTAKLDRVQHISTPTIYAYTIPSFAHKAWTTRKGGKGLLKVGYTRRTANDRIQDSIKMPKGEEIHLVLEESAMYADSGKSGEHFSDKDVHKVLEKCGYKRSDGEWFEVTKDEVLAVIHNLREGRDTGRRGLRSYRLRTEQAVAVQQTASYFRTHSDNPQACHYLWNAKMRFGKTFTAYKLAQEMGWSRLLVVTYKPAVQNEWRVDVEQHVDFEGWQFLADKNTQFEEADQSKPIVWFVSYQDILQRDANNNIKKRLQAIFDISWDCVIQDEYHFGAWRDAAKDIFEDTGMSQKQKELEASIGSDNYIVEDYSDAGPLQGISYNHMLYLSGTPFKALASGMFNNQQIFNWSYTDEQNAKAAWSSNPANSGNPNPYASLPKFNLLTYKIPSSVLKHARETMEDEFSLNRFFEAKKEPSPDSDETAQGKKKREVEYKFLHLPDVKAWLRWIRGQLDIGESSRPNITPYLSEDTDLATRHSLWFLPNVASCDAMYDLLQSEPGWKDNYTVVNASGKSAGIGAKALPPVTNAIGDGLVSRTITLTCGKLTMGVTVPQWGSVFMLRDTKSPEEYYQVAFRAGTPWTHKNLDSGEEHVLIVLIFPLTGHCCSLPVIA